MGRQGAAGLFLLGKDYHLGDLLWLTAVIAEYRRQREPKAVLIGCPDRAVNRILELSPVVDDVLYGSDMAKIRAAVGRQYPELVVHDLRPLALGIAMIRDFRHHLPWLYYRDLWMQPRGQWLATFLRLGQLSDHKPLLQPRKDVAISPLPVGPYVLLAPHIGSYKVPLTRRFWRRIKGWDWDNWIELGKRLRVLGFEVVTLAGPGQAEIPGTRPIIGLPIRQVASLIEGAATLVSGESGLWFIAAALKTPFLIVPWWLPRSVNWPEPMSVPHRLIYRDQATVEAVVEAFLQVTAVEVPDDPARLGDTVLS